jgi:tetratricopeptide (TPR) repeat protein
MRTFYIFLLSTVVFFAGTTQAKDNDDLIKANYYYRHFAFYEAIPYFEKVAEQANDPVIYAQLANCYRNVNNLEKATAAYEKAVNIKGAEDAVMLQYGQLLMQLKRYEDAAKWLKKYQVNHQADRRVANLIAGCSMALQQRLNDIPSGSAHLLDFNTSGSEFAPTLWKGKLVFTSDTAIGLKKKTDRWTGNSYMNLYSVACDAGGKCGNAFTKVGEESALNIKYHNGPCTFSGDGKLMYFTRSRYSEKFLSKGSIANKDSMVLLEIMVARYNEKKKEFDELVPFQHNSDKYSVAHPAISPNGKVLVFSSNMGKGMGYDLYMCRKTGKDRWSKPEPIANVINTEGEEVFPYWADSTTLYFSSDGHEGLGGLDIYKAKWNDASKTFSSPENIGMPVNSSYDDISLALYADGRSSYFSSSRPAEKGGDNIYYYKREMVFLDLKITDSGTHEPLAGTRIRIDASGATKDMLANNDGGYFTRLTPGLKYTVTLSRDGYDSRTIAVYGTGRKEVDTLFYPLALRKASDADAAPIIPFAQLVGTPEVDKIYEICHFYFADAVADLSNPAKACLDSLVNFLNQNTTMRIQIRAHTDCRGENDYNFKLSNDRANAVVKYLVEKGIPAKRLEYKGFGSSMPHVKCECANCTEYQHYQNRILEFKVLQL